MKNIKKQEQGFSLVELMVASTIGLMLSFAVMEVYLAQTQMYKTSNSQDIIQNTENAIANLITPTIRSAGFAGCGNISSAVSVLNAGGASPIGSINTNPTMIMGFSGGSGSISLSQNNPDNSSNANSWSPALDSTLVGQVQSGNDVLIVLGSVPDAQPVGLTNMDPASNFFEVLTTTDSNAAANQFGAVSDCTKTAIFRITGVTSNSITHDTGAGTLENSTSTFPVNFQLGAQFVPMQQTAFFVGQGQGDQSALMRATLDGDTWTVQPLVPGVELMKVQYGIGTNGVVTQYVPANSVTNWGQVYSVRIGFLIQGQTGSGISGTHQFTVLGTQVTVPADNKLRHVFELTINLRNAIS